jgi:hypothetical protein
MDRAVRRPLGKRKSEFANKGEVSLPDQPLLETPQGREPGTHNEAPSVADEEIAEKSVGSRPQSDATAFHDPSGDEETDDGLNESDEALRRSAEDRVVEDEDEAETDIPVFDRGSEED